MSWLKRVLAFLAAILRDLPVPPDPTPPPAPDPPPAPPVDAVPASAVRWVGVLGGLEGYAVRPDVALAITSITNPARPTICWKCSLPQTWQTDPSGLTIGNLWIILRVGRDLYGAPIEWLLTGQRAGACSTMENIPPQPPFVQGKGEPLASHVPRSGDLVWFCVSSLTPYGKLPAGAPRERSLIVETRWP